MAQVSSTSRVGTTEPFELQISRGQIPFHKKKRVTITGGVT
jgi:hypothetical protein